jgi:methionine-rich copper-binding protein CopC
VGVLGFASPAAAHDELVASTPSIGEQLASAPSEVSLTFSADVLTIGAAVIIADGAGRDWVADEPVVTDGVVTVGLQSGMPDAGYEIRWRVVSEDGHPISGLVPFTVGMRRRWNGHPPPPARPPTRRGHRLPCRSRAHTRIRGSCGSC